MKRTSYRPKRVAALIRQEISNIFYNELKDPRLHDGLISLIEVRLSPDLKNADVFVSVLDDDKIKDVMDGFKASKGFIKRQLSKNLNLRFTPEINFKLDTSIKDNMRLNSLIEKVNKEDNR